jgi:predicted ATPase
LKDTLHETKLLLVLDNFEQVGSAAIQVADLLTVCPQLTVLVTSREVLHVRAEHEFPVPALTLPDPKHLPDLVALSQYEAVALFIERAQAARPDFHVTNVNAPAGAEICSRLEGLPLAIELAAARIKLFPPQALLARLGQRLPFLTSSTRDVPASQQTLRKTIQWSYDLLSAQEQRIFRWLTVFSDGCTLQAFEAGRVKRRGITARAAWRARTRCKSGAWHLKGDRDRYYRRPPLPCGAMEGLIHKGCLDLLDIG